ncbi:MAG: LysM peptidoglycan-binding domain-containing protein [Gemmatimonadota bacterium]
MPRNLALSAVRTTIAVAFAVMGATSTYAQDATTQQQREHVVRPGDTLWDLARTYLNDPFQWRLIFEANQGVVEDAHWIFPTERLIIPGLLQARPATEPLGLPFTMPVEPAVEVVTTEPVDPPTVVMEVDLRRPVVPLAEYLAAPWLSTNAEREVSGRIERMADPAAVGDRLAPALHPNDRVHVTATGARAGDSLLIVRFGRTVGDRGRIVEPLGVLSVESVEGGVATASLARQFGGAKVGDAVMPLAAVPVIRLGEPAPFAGGPEGRLLQFLHDEPLHGTTDVAFISLGREAGVDIGDEFAAYVVTSSDDDRAAPMPLPTRVAILRVVRVGDRSSTARVMSVSSVALQGGLPIRLVAKVQ